MAFSIYDFNDRELLYKLMDAVDEHGHASSREIALAMGLGEQAARNIGTRFAWMRAYGIVDRETGKSGESRWFLTLMGRELLAGQLSAAAERTLEALKPSQRALVMDALALDAKQQKQWGKVYRRNWQHRTGGKL